MKNFTSLKFLACCLFLGVLFGSFAVSEVKAQTCTTQNSPGVYQPGWIKGTTVQVYIDPAITGDQRNAVVQAFTNWGNAGGTDGNNSRVTYTIVNSPPPASSYSFIVTSTAPVTYPGTRAETGNTVDQYGYTLQAQTSLDPRVTDPAAVLEVMSHEIGHPAGLDDCLTCAPGDSVMGPGPPQGQYNTVVGRPTSPSPCDNQRLQQADYPYCSPPVGGDCAVWDPNTCTCNQYNGGGGGGGSEPGGGGGDYCTPYYWVYYESYDGGQTWDMVDYEYAGCW